MAVLRALLQFVRPSRLSTFPKTALRLASTFSPPSFPNDSPPSKPNPTRAASVTPNANDAPLRSLTDGLSDAAPTISPSETQVDWARSFHGLSSEPFSAETSAILLAEIAPDDVEIKPEGIIYLPEIKYRRILNKAFGPGGWGLVPRGETIVTGKLVTREYALVCGGRSVLHLYVYHHSCVYCD